MSAFDYARLDGGFVAEPTSPLRTARRSIGLLATALTSVATWCAYQYNNHTGRRFTPFSPKDGIENVICKVKPSTPGVLQFLPIKVPEEGGPTCYFTYGIMRQEDLGNRAFTAGSIPQDAWAYGTKLGRGLLAHPTGRPEDIVKGRLFCWPPHAFPDKLKAADLQRNYNPDNAIGKMRRGLLSVVKKDGSAVEAVWYFSETPDDDPANMLKRVGPQEKITRLKSLDPAARGNSSKQGVRIDFRGMSADQILTAIGENDLDVPSEVAAWFLLGNSVRRQPKAMVDRIRDDARCKKLKDSIRDSVPALSPVKISNTWLGTRDLMITDPTLMSALEKATIFQSGGLEAQGLANIFNSLANLGTLPAFSASHGPWKPSDLLMETLCDRTLRKVYSFNPQEISNLLNALARLNHWPGEAVLKTLFDEALGKAHIFKPQEISNLVNAAARLAYNPGDRVLQTFAAQATRNAANFNSQGLANTLNGFAKIGFYPGDACLAALCTECTLKGHSFNSQEIANVLNAVAKLGYHPDEDLINVMVPEAMRKVTTFNTQEISNTLNALAKLGYNPGPSMLDLFCDEAVRKVDTFEAQGIANTVNSVSKFNYKPSAQFLRSMAAEGLKRYKQFESQHMANTLNGFAKLEYNPGEPLLKALSDEALTKATTFESQGVANFLNALCKLEFYPGDALLRALSSVVLKKAPEFNPQEISNTLHAMARLGFYPGEDVLDAICATAVSSSDKFEAQGIANTLNALSRLNFKPPHELIEAFRIRSLDIAENFDAQNLANTMHALCFQKEVDAELFNKFFAVLPSDANLLEKEALTQLYTVKLALKHEHPKSGLNLPAPIDEACSSLQISLHDRIESSVLHMEVSNSIDSLGLSHINEDSTTGLSVDIALPDHKVAIEVDGPSHFLTGSADGVENRYIGTTILKQRLLQKMGWKVISIPYFDWAALGGSNERTSYLQQKLQKAGLTVA